MIATAVNKPMKDYLKVLKIFGHCIFSEDTMAYLTSPDNKCMAYEFKQENESDMEFLENFSKWMHEWPKVEGHVEYYLLMGLRYNKHLSEEQYEYLERNFCDCFSFSHGWYYELNHRVRYRLHITLVMSQNRNFRNLVKKEIPSHIKEKLATVSLLESRRAREKQMREKEIDK